MGLLGAIGAGIGAAGGAMAQMGMERLRAEIEEERMLRLDEMRGKRAEEAEIRKEDRAMGRVKAETDERGRIIREAVEKDKASYVDQFTKKGHEAVAELGGVADDEPFTAEQAGYSRDRELDASIGGLIASGRDPKELGTLASLRKQDRQAELAAKQLEQKEKRDAAEAAYQRGRLATEDRKVDAMFARINSGGSGGGSKSGGDDFKFDADKQRKAAYAIVGLNSKEIELLSDDMASKEAKGKVEAKMAAGDALFKLALANDVPVEEVYRARVKANSAKAAKASEESAKTAVATPKRESVPPRATTPQREVAPSGNPNTVEKIGFDVTGRPTLWAYRGGKYKSEAAAIEAKRRDDDIFREKARMLRNDAARMAAGEG